MQPRHCVTRGRHWITPSALACRPKIRLEVCPNHMVSWARCNNAPMVEKNRLRAQANHGGHAMRHEQDRPPTLTKLRHLTQALLLEVSVADGEYFVNE